MGWGSRRTLPSTPEGGHCAGYHVHQRTKSSKVRTVVDTLGHLPAVWATPASAQQRLP